MRTSYRTSALLLMLLGVALFSCKKEDTSAGIEITNGSFEDSGFSTDGWVVSNTGSSSDVPTGGGAFSLMIAPDGVPAEGYADYTINNLSGTKNLKLTCCIKAFDSWPGSVSLRKVSSSGVISVLGTEASDVSEWTLKTIETSATFNSGDKLVVHLSAGSTEIPVATQYDLFDLVTLSEE